MYIKELLYDIEPIVNEQLTLENSNTYEILISNPKHVENIFKFLSETPTTLISNYLCDMYFINKSNFSKMCLEMYLLMQIVTELETYFPSEENFNSE